MRVPSTPAAAASSRPAETQSTQSAVAPAGKPEVSAGPAPQGKPLNPVDGFVPGLMNKLTPDAQTRAKQGEQLGTIADGVRDGSLTEQETQGLLKEQEAIANAQREAMADGNLTPEERLKLGMMQMRADRNIDQARGNAARDVFAPFDADARRQAAQIDQIASGRTNGNVTNFEAGKLLGQQADIAGSRGANGPLANAITDMKQNEAAKDISLHGKPGTQLELKPFPQPLPLLRPEPKPLPEFPTRPDLSILFRGGIAG